MDNPFSPILPVTQNETQEKAIQLDLKTFYLGGIFFLFFFTIIHQASSIIIPIVLAFVLKLVLQPLLRMLEGFHLPRVMAAASLLIILVCIIIGFGTALSTPVTSWTQKLPESFPKLQERLSFLNKSLQTTQKFVLHAEDITQGGGSKVVPVVVEGNRLSDKIFATTQAMASSLFTTVLVLFFLLISGDTFLRRLVEVLPRFKDKRQAVDISQHIERDISIYLMTITVMNALVGIATWIVMAFCKMDDPLLWGAIAFLLNYVPIVGPLIAVGLFFFAAMLAMPTLGEAFLPAALYLVIHLAEGTFITPMLLAKRFTLNPVLVVLSLVFWYWMWGFIGAILAMPLLAITKIICDRIAPLNAFGHFLEG